MDRFPRQGISKQNWINSSTPTVIDYNHRQSQIINQGQIAQSFPVNVQQSPLQPPPMFLQNSNLNNPTDLNDLVQLQLKMLNTTPNPPPSNIFGGSKLLTSFDPSKSFEDNSTNKPEKYNPFIEDAEDYMEISDDEKESQNANVRSKDEKAGNIFSQSQKPIAADLEVKSGAAFYQGLILYLPPFEQLAHTYRGSPALKMLFCSFEFSLKTPVKIETKPKENDPNVSVSTVYFNDHFIASGTGMAPHVEASVRALELLSETCYTIQAKEDYYLKCKLIDAELMKTLNLKKWEAVSEKYPNIVEVCKSSHIQKTFAVFLESHTSSGMYDDIVCCNLTRQEVNNIKSVVEFFNLTMLPCSISTNLSKKETPCVVTIQKYTSAKKLLDILIGCGGENEKFKLFPPDTFKDFYKLHPNYWDPNLKNKPGNNIHSTKTTLDDPSLQAMIMEPYKNLISELFEKHKTLPKKDTLPNDTGLRKAGDDFMKTTFQIDITQSKNKAPVERMTLLLNYMEQLQEYGSRVLTSGRADMIKIYHNAIDNVRKDLDECRKDIEKEQKNQVKADTVKSKESSKIVPRSKTPPSRKKSPPRRRSRSPAKKSHGTSKRSPSPKRKARSKSPRRHNRVRRSPSPRRKPRSPTRRVRSPLRSSPPRRRSPPPCNEVDISIFKDQLRRYVDILRRFRIEIEDTPIERRDALRNRLMNLREQLIKFRQQVKDNSSELGEFQYELEICRDELVEQNDLINGKPGPHDLPPGIALEPSSSMYDYDRSLRPPMPGPGPLPTPLPFIPAPTNLYGQTGFPYPY